MLERQRAERALQQAEQAPGEIDRGEVPRPVHHQQEGHPDCGGDRHRLLDDAVLFRGLPAKCFKQ